MKESVTGIKLRSAVSAASVLTHWAILPSSHKYLTTVGRVKKQGLFTATPGQIGSAQVPKGKGLGLLDLTSLQLAPPTSAITRA